MHVRRTRSAFPLAARSRAHGSAQVLKGSANPINLLGQQTPLPCGLAMGPVPTPQHGVLNVGPQTKRWVGSPGGRQKGLHPRKKKRYFYVGYSLCFNQREYKLLCAQTSTIFLRKENKEKTQNPCHIPRWPFLGLSRLLGHGSGQRLFERLLSFGKNQSPDGENSGILSPET